VAFIGNFPGNNTGVADGAFSDLDDDEDVTTKEEERRAERVRLNGLAKAVARSRVAALAEHRRGVSASEIFKKDDPQSRPVLQARPVPQAPPVLQARPVQEARPVQHVGLLEQRDVRKKTNGQFFAFIHHDYRY
jgi:hypothetical protein